MNSKSRTTNSILNGLSGILLSLVTTLLSFGVRTVFIATLDEVYLGVNGLFSNIFTLLSLAELGIGNAIIYRLYKPIAEDNVDRLKSLIHFYKKCYNVIAIAVIVLGIALIPFLKYLINTDSPVEGLYCIYCIYVLDTAATYVLVYKSSLMSAYQRERVVTLNTLAMNITTSALQILVLLLFKSFYAYLVVKIVCTLAFRFILSLKVDKDYYAITKTPYVELDESSKKAIFADVKSIFAYKVGSAVLNGSDNIIISSFISTGSVGIYSNYSMVISAVKTIMTRFLHGFTASIGNLNTKEDSEKKTEIYFSMNYLAFAMFAFSSSCILSLMNDFISIWIGNKFLMDLKVLFALVASFYISGMQGISITYRETLGIFKEGQLRPVATSIINIVLSIVGAIRFGVFGVFLATIIAELSTYWFDVFLICKKGLHISPSRYYFKYFYYILCCFVICSLVFGISAYLPKGSLALFCLKSLIIASISGIMVIVVSIPCKEFRILFQRIKQLLWN